MRFLCSEGPAKNGIDAEYFRIEISDHFAADTLRVVVATDAEAAAAEQGRAFEGLLQLQKGLVLRIRPVHLAQDTAFRFTIRRQ